MEGVDKSPLISTTENHHTHRDQLMAIDLQYPLVPYEKDPYTKNIQLGIVDGLQAFASVCKPKILKKYAVDVNWRNALLRLHKKDYARMQELRSPDKISEFNLDTEAGHAFLGLEARLFLDKLDPVFPVATALYAKALAEKIRCDIRRNEGISSAQERFHNTYTSLDTAGCIVEPLIPNESHKNFLDPQDLLKVPLTPEDQIGFKSRDMQEYHSSANTLQYLIDTQPSKAAEFLDTYANISLSLTINKFNHLLGRTPIPIGSPVKGKDLAELVNDTDERGRVQFLCSDDKLSIYTAVAFVEHPALYPYIHKFLYNTYAPEFLSGSTAQSYLDFNLYDTATQYDFIPLCSSYVKKSLKQFEDMDHEYVPNNLVGARSTLALDYLYRRNAFGGHPSYLGVNNSMLFGEDAIKTAMDLSVRTLDNELRQAKFRHVDLGITPLDSAYPSVSLEETAKQFHVHDPATLAFVTNLPLTVEDKRMYLFLTQPAVMKLVDARLHEDNQKHHAIYKSIHGKLPDLLYEMQKATLFMPQEAKKQLHDVLQNITIEKTYSNYPSLDL